MVATSIQVAVDLLVLSAWSDPVAQLTQDEFRNFFLYYKDQAHQRKAIDNLFTVMQPELLDQDSEWVVQFRNPPAPQPGKVQGPVNPDLMHSLTGHPASSFDHVFCDDFNSMLAVTGFDKDLTAFRMLMAQCMHETCNFAYMKELGGAAYFTSMYEGRSDLGNDQPGDGARFSGCGAIQCTGRANFQASYDYMHEKMGIIDSRVMAEGTAYTADVYPFSICIGWLLNNNYLEVCKTGDVEYATRVLNGGYNGLDDRIAKLRICDKVITSL